MKLSNFCLVGAALLFAMAEASTMRLTISSVWIGVPRSLIKDTVQVTVASSGGPSVQAANITVKLGDFGKGTFDPAAIHKPVALEFAVLDDATTVDVAYIVLNSGIPDSDTTARRSFHYPDP